MEATEAEEATEVLHQEAEVSVVAATGAEEVVMVLEAAGADMEAAAGADIDPVNPLEVEEASVVVEHQEGTGTGTGTATLREEAGTALPESPLLTAIHLEMTNRVEEVPQGERLTTTMMTIKHLINLVESAVICTTPHHCVGLGLHGSPSSNGAN